MHWTKSSRLSEGQRLYSGVGHSPPSLTFLLATHHSPFNSFPHFSTVVTDPSIASQLFQTSRLPFTSFESRPSAHRDHRMRTLESKFGPPRHQPRKAAP